MARKNARNTDGEEMFEILQSIRKELRMLRQSQPLCVKPVYTNGEVMEMLGVNFNTLKKMRDSGELGYTQYGCRFFYSLEDLQGFMKRRHSQAKPASESVPVFREAN